jgi:transposase
MVDVPCFVGIEVAKAQLDMALRPAGERWAVPNDASGIVPLVDRLQALQPTLIVLEATGGLERAATVAWAAAGLPVVVVNPRQARDVARATGPLAKTEAWDARALAHFADVIRPTPRRKSCVPFWGAASHCSSCGRRHSTAWRGRASASQRPSQLI